MKTLTKSSICGCVVPRASTRTNVSRGMQTRCSNKNNFPDVDRRGVLLGVSAGLLGVSNVLRTGCNDIALADDVPFETYFGLATPPTSYGGYGGNANESPKYSFDYPSTWKSVPVNKVEKGTQGIDCRLVSPRGRTMTAFVIALGRAGEDDKSFRLTDVDSTFQGFAGADYDLQDALVGSMNTTKTERTIDGQQYFDYDIESPDTHYLSTITVKNGKVFAFFVKSPARQFGAMEGVFRGMLSSFRTL